MIRVCVFCASSPGHRPLFTDAARELGGLLGARGIGLVYGGGRNGLMGVVADSALEAGAEVTGIITDQLHTLERGHSELTSMHIVQSMHERKAMMASLADGFIALPGGYGTLEELCEVVTWTQLAIHDKPCIVVNVDGYFDPLIAQFDRAVVEGFLRPDHRVMLQQTSSPSGALDLVGSWSAGTSPNPFAPARRP
jgi:uncharacterized protein (TIGR00730 family)